MTPITKQRRAIGAQAREAGFSVYFVSRGVQAWKRLHNYGYRIYVHHNKTLYGDPTGSIWTVELWGKISFSGPISTKTGLTLAEALASHPDNTV